MPKVATTIYSVSAVMIGMGWFGHWYLWPQPFWNAVAYGGLGLLFIGTLVLVVECGVKGWKS